MTTSADRLWVTYEDQVVGEIRPHPSGCRGHTCYLGMAVSRVRNRQMDLGFTVDGVTFTLTPDPSARD
ncbi:MAG: hypothetical protein KC561_16030, partial [Myxococcales bacterium]|nr:hypothetical protein [Myxococcales bacterium]